MTEDFPVSVRHACKEVVLAKSTYLYKCKQKDDLQIIEQLTILTEKHPTIGFWMSFHRLRRMGNTWNHKRVYRVYTAMKLNIRRRAKKRLPPRAKREFFQPSEPNQVWSIDFMHDSLWNGRNFRLLNIIDDYYIQVLVAIEVDTILPAQRVIRVLERLKEVKGLPQMIRVDNGPEFISRKLELW